MVIVLTAIFANQFSKIEVGNRMSIEDDHKKLGLTLKMDHEEKRKKFHELVQQYHPDKVGSQSEEKMKELNCAWERIEQFDKEGKALILKKNEKIALANEFREIQSVKESIKNQLIQRIKIDQNNELRDVKKEQKSKAITLIPILAIFLLFLSIFSSIISNNLFTMPGIILTGCGIGYFAIDIYWRYTEKIDDINANTVGKIDQIYQILLNKKVIFDAHEKILREYKGTAGMTKETIIKLILNDRDPLIFENKDASNEYAEYIFYSLIEDGYIGRIPYGNNFRYIPIPI